MTGYTPGDNWEEHYRGYELRINNQGDIWWQVYNGTDRLHLEPHQSELVEQFLELKPLGGRVRVTDGGAVITRQEDEDAEGDRNVQSLDDYTAIYVGDLDLDGDLIPKGAPEYSVPVRPNGLSSGDLWPSVYDGSRYSFSMSGDAWWQNPQTNKRHPIRDGLPDSIQSTLSGLKPEGGSFRVTPWGDVITLVRSPASQTVRDQFSDLPRVVRNIIKLRRERADLQMVPVYISHLSEVPLEVEDPPSLTDGLNAKEQDALEDWAASLGTTTETSVKSHEASKEPYSQTDSNTTENEEAGDVDETATSAEDDDEILPADDPIAWVKRGMDKTEDRLNDQ